MKRRVLIVDDHEDFRKIIKEYLLAQDLNCEIFEASTGEMALTKSSCIKPDVVLMDINLPNVNGLAAAKHIKGDFPDCDIIILTMFDVKAFKKVAQEVEARDFIGKAEVYDRLVPAIKKCMKDKEASNSRKGKLVSEK